MQGYKLLEGQYKKRKLTKDEMWNSFNWLFSSHSRNDSSYKFIFLKSIIDCLDKKDSFGKISFDSLFTEFTRISWNLVLKYDISQKGVVKDGRISALERILKMNYTSEDRFEELFDEDKKKICDKIKSECKKYVVGALYGDTDGVIYSFSKKEEWILLNPEVEEFIKNNIGIIENLNYYKWAQFYMSVNDVFKTNKLDELVDSGNSRKNENIYRTVLANEFENKPKVERQQINTIELLLSAEAIEDVKMIENCDVEKEFFKDFSSMRQYMSDHILLVNQLKKEKNII